MSRLHLPIDDFLPQIREALESHDALVLTAAPGAGKTTRLPPALLEFIKGQILVLEPRRMAAIAAASRIAEENGWSPGAEVGWQVRFDNKTSPSTRLVFLTEALLARRMVGDPELKDVGAVVLDEFHERSLHTDLTLGLLKELRELGRDVKLIVMSATLTAERIAAYLGGAPVIAVPGKLFELNVQHSKGSQRLQTDPNFYDSLTDMVKAAVGAGSRDALVFLPGVGEIERTRERLSAWAGDRGIDLVPLHGSLPLEDQRRALQKGPRRRIVLSTNIAESSVTVDGVDTVIDTGLQKSSRFDVRTGFSRLELTRISLSSAIQRSGRAARQFPGTAYRLWNKQDELSMPKDEVPEIQRADLSEALLFLAHQGVSDFSAFPWFEAPAARNLQTARDALVALDALDAGNRLTERGRRLLKFPLPPRIGALLLAGETLKCADLAARTAAILQERDFVRDDVARSHLGDRLECDLSLRLQLLPQFKPRSILQAADQLKRLAPGESKNGDPLTLRRLLLSAFPDRLCRRRGSSDRGVMAGGRGVKLGPGSLVKESEFFLALGGVEGLSDAETTVGLACGLDKDFVLKELGPRVRRHEDLFTDPSNGKIFARHYRAFGDLPLEEANLSPAAADQIASLLPRLLANDFAEVLKRNEDLAAWFARWTFLRRFITADFDFTPDVLADVFSQAAYGEKSVEAVAKKDLIYFFEQALPADLARELAALPARLQVPSGSLIAVHYPADREPYMEVRLQEVFGWTETPKLLGGRVPVVLHLLGPNYRPQQVTADLASFWKNGYPEVRKELRSRYPKHSWPDDPLTAKPEAKGRPRR